MKSTFSIIIIVCICVFGFAQKQYHVFPENHGITPGKPSGDGSLQNPWDLQSALNKKEIIKANDTIWLHAGQYNGRFTSTLTTGADVGYITITSFYDDKVVLNGNIASSKKSVLDVVGNGLVFKNFEITFKGDFVRNSALKEFQAVSGIDHRQGANCKFINITIHNVPGSGIGSWKRTSNAEIKNCVIYNNGYIGKRGHGVGIYVQNESNQMRIIDGNIIFGNYYKGIEVWSASSGHKQEFVKNVNITNNVIFNSGLPINQLKDNLIVATGDIQGVNIAKNIVVKNNVFYHNTDIKNGQIIGGGMSLTLGFNQNAPVENIKVYDNVIVGGKDGLRLMHVKGLEFKKNIVYSEFVRLNPEFLNKNNQFSFSENTYFTRKSTPFRIAKTKDYNLVEWQKELKLDAKSSWATSKQFNPTPLLKIIQVDGRSNEFFVNVLSTHFSEVEIDFSKFQSLKGSHYRVLDIENSERILKKGVLSQDSKLNIDMESAYQSNPSTHKSLSNFGVFKVVFETENPLNETDKPESSLKRLLRKLGF